MRTVCCTNARLTLFLATLLPFAFSGCTVITIKNADSVKTKFYPGLVILHVADTHNNVAINSWGVGTQLNNQGATFGYFQDQRIHMNDLSKCVTIYFDDQTNVLKKQAADFN